MSNSKNTISNFIYKQLFFCINNQTFFRQANVKIIQSSPKWKTVKIKFSISEPERHLDKRQVSKYFLSQTHENDYITQTDYLNDPNIRNFYYENFKTDCSINPNQQFCPQINTITNKKDKLR